MAGADIDDGVCGTLETTNQVYSETCGDLERTINKSMQVKPNKVSKLMVMFSSMREMVTGRIRMRYTAKCLSDLLPMKEDISHTGGVPQHLNSELLQFR
jgi:hypothetical protein